MPSFKTPTQAQIDAAVQRMRSPEFSAYFFSRLENPQWVVPLNDLGQFATPPPAIPVADGGVTFAHWPASKYLARMAKHAPSDVAAIFRELHTGNVFVIGDMVNAAKDMPASIAATLVPAISKAAQSGTLWVYFKDATDLCVLLANAGEASAAISLANSLFTPRFEEGQDRPNQSDEYWYKECLQKALPILTARVPKEMLCRLCHWLKIAVDALNNTNSESGSDYSYIWRPAIEEHEQNQNYELAGTLAGFVRQAFEQSIHQNAVSLHEALEILRQHRYLVFGRIRMHLVQEFADQDPALARQMMMDREMFNSHEYKHEYAMFVGRRLDMLTPEERDGWYEQLDAGPDMSDFDERAEDALGRPATEEDRQNRIQYWQFEKLHCVRRHLEGDRLKFYRSMLDKHGEPELADLNSLSTFARWGDESPMTVEELCELGFEQAVERVSSWRPGEDRFLGPSIEGLAQTFGQYVATNPEQFATEATALIGRPAIFIRRFIEQIHDSITKNRQIEIMPLFDLCEHVISQPSENGAQPVRDSEELTDKDLQWTRDAVSRLLKGVCGARANGVPTYSVELRNRIWEMINALCRDPANSYIVHDVSEDDPRIKDYLHLGINSPRGQAMEAALAYANWVMSHLEGADWQTAKAQNSFERTPEFQELLEWQIDPANRRIEVLAVIGSQLSLIYLLGKEWLAENSGRLFRLEGFEKSPQVTDGWAVWNAFLVWNRPHAVFYRLFKEQFAYAVQQSFETAQPDSSREHPMYRLGEHLMILYGRGDLGLDDDGGLLRKFISDSSPDIRRNSIGFIGQSLQGNEQVPSEIVERFQALWEIYWAGPGRKDVEEKPDAWLFGTWFSSEKFPDTWALEQLERYIDVSPTPEPDHAIAKRLAVLAQSDIERVVRILDRMVRGDREGWRIHMWLEPLEEILETAIDAGGQARTQAEKTIDYLGRRGHTRFGELLKRQG